jgi:mannose-6-phosphate isomerase
MSTWGDRVHPIRFQPVYHKRVWGGRAFSERLGRTLPGTDPIGESWEIADRPEAQSVDPATGRTLRRLLTDDPESIMGPGWNPERPFPVLVKWLDCRDRLSLQVHPPAAIANELGGEPKTECWYIADATDDAALIVGLKAGVSRRAFEQAIHDEALEPLLHRFRVQRGNSMLLEAGRLHAIDAGNLILEIQQNSDTTYRVYDWGRKGLDGKPRELHVEESLESIDFDDFEPAPEPPFTDPGETVIADCAEFRIRQINLDAGQTIDLPAAEEPRIVSLVAGGLGDGDRQFTAGDNVLIPYACATAMTARSPTRILVTDRFV